MITYSNVNCNQCISNYRFLTDQIESNRLTHGLLNDSRDTSPLLLSQAQPAPPPKRSTSKICKYPKSPYRTSRGTSPTSWSRTWGRRANTCPPLHHTKGILLTRGDQASGKRLNPKTHGVKENGSRSIMTNTERQTNLTITRERQQVSSPPDQT